MTSSDNNDEYERYLEHLMDAEHSLSCALDCLYKHDGVKRGLGYRLRLARAQSTVMSLFVREVSHKEGRKSGGTHEWELINPVRNEWECIYCEKRTVPKKIGHRQAFGPDCLRAIPLYGRRWRCRG